MLKRLGAFLAPRLHDQHVVGAKLIEIARLSLATANGSSSEHVPLLSVCKHCWAQYHSSVARTCTIRCVVRYIVDIDIDLKGVIRALRHY